MPMFCLHHSGWRASALMPRETSRLRWANIRGSASYQPLDGVDQRRSPFGPTRRVAGTKQSPGCWPSATDLSRAASRQTPSNQNGAGRTWACAMPNPITQPGRWWWRRRSRRRRQHSRSRVLWCAITITFKLFLFR